MLQTANLQLIRCEWKHREAFARGSAALAAVLQARVPPDWPAFPEAFALPAAAPPDPDPLADAWPALLFLHVGERALVGNGGFKGPPDAVGSVEIGYEIAPEYRNRGLATEAVQALLTFAFTHEAVRLVVAHTLAAPNASQRVLYKVGMRVVAELIDPDVGPIQRWHVGRADRLRQEDPG